MQPNCSTRCTCRNREFVCESCTCIFDGATCIIYGDRHYQTYDLRYFDFQGNCEYTVSRPCVGNEFNISVRNEAHNDRVSCADQVTIQGGGITVVLGRGGTITIDNALQANTGDGVIMQNIDVQVIRTGGNANVIFPTHGVRVFYDGLCRIEISVSAAWQGRLCGLCGNYNGNQFDDNLSPNNTELTDDNAFGNSWRIGDGTGCNTPSLPTSCDANVQTAASDLCRGAFLSQFFSGCSSAVPPTPFFQNCTIDTCACNVTDRLSCFCESLATYASACAANGVSLPDWRTEYNCSKFTMH